MYSFVVLMARSLKIKVLMVLVSCETFFPGLQVAAFSVTWPFLTVGTFRVLFLFFYKNTSPVRFSKSQTRLSDYDSVLLD